jgi:transcriptional regulator with XRE-family HTH domain
MQAHYHENGSEQIVVYTGDAMAGRPPEKEAPPFGQRLAAVRKARGMTQQQLAELLDMTVKGVDYYERRARNPSSEFVQRAADALGVAVTELLGENGNGPRRKRGPSPKLQRQLEEIQRLPKGKQKFVSDFLDTVLQQAHG